MASEEIGLVLSHRPNNNHPQFLFSDDSNLAFRCNPNPPQQHQRHPSTHHPAGHNKTTRELTGFIEHQNRHYQPQATTEFRRSMCDDAPPYHRGVQVWEGRNGRDSSSPSGDGSDSVDDDDDDDDKMIDQDGDDHVVGLVNSSDDIKNTHKSNLGGHISGEKNGNGKRNHLSSIGSSSEAMKEGIVMLSGNDINDVRASPNENHQQGQLCQYQNAITIADPSSEMYYSQYLRAVEGAGFKDMLVENGRGFGGRKDTSNSGGSGESLKAILSDPLTGVLMDDAMILPCGHSFGSGGMQHVMRMDTEIMDAIFIFVLLMMLAFFEHLFAMLSDCGSKICADFFHLRFRKPATLVHIRCRKAQSLQIYLCDLLFLHSVGKKSCKLTVPPKEEIDWIRRKVIVAI